MDRKRRELLLKEKMAVIGKRLREERLKRNWDLLEVVIRSGGNQQTIYNLENGLENNPTIKTLINLADAFEMDILTLLA